MKKLHYILFSILLFALYSSLPAQLQIKKYFSAYGAGIVDTVAIVSGNSQEGNYGKIFISGNPESNGLGLYIFDVEFRLSGFTPFQTDSVSVDLRYINYPLFPNGNLIVAFLHQGMQLGKLRKSNGARDIESIKKEQGTVVIDSLTNNWKRFFCSVPSGATVDEIAFIFTSAQPSPFFALCDLGMDNIRIKKPDVGWSVVTEFSNITVDVKEKTIPTDFVLLQNYPNPFNPATTIRYQISEVGIVNLKVYDVLGREVATLVNEQKTPGDYEVKFDAGGLASGTYVYCLQAGSFIQTRKMILLK